MRRQLHSYDADPSVANAPFGHDEAVELLRDIPKDLVKSRENVEHLIRRVVATAAALRQTRFEFDAEIRHRSSVLPASGGATVSVNPEQAARFLSPDQLSRLFDRFAQERLAALDAAKNVADERAQRADRAIAELTAAANDPLLDAATRSVLHTLVSRLERP
jgi:hypothetical protein